VFAARDIAFIRSIPIGDYFLGFLTVRAPRSDPQLDAAEQQAFNDCFANAFFAPCSADEVQLAMLGIVTYQTPLPLQLSRAFADCLLAVCSRNEEDSVIAYLQARVQLNNAFMGLIADIQATTRQVAAGWIAALAAA
jgi:hypothetical protein